MKKVSVVISTFNRSKLLKRAIESVLNQSYKDYEIIVVDDGSTDDTEAVATSYDLTYHKIEHFGCDTKPKNEGAKLAKGKYINFLDDDCVMRPDHLQALVNEIEKSDCDVVYGDRWVYEEEKSVAMGIFHDFDPYLLLRRNYIDTSDALIKREALFDIGGFDEKYKKYVDWNIWVRMAKMGKKFKRVPLVLTDYHVYPHSKSNRKEDEKGFCVPAWDPMDCVIEQPYLKEVKEPRVAIFSLTYDRLELTKQCFKSLNDTAGYSFDHFIIDNGSTDGTKEWLSDYADSRKDGTNIFLNQDNKGLSIASNQAIDIIKEEKYDIIVKYDNDALSITKGWLAKMVEIYKSNRMLVMSPYIQGLKDNPGGAQRLDYGKVCGEMVGLTRHIGGIVHFVTAKAYDNFRWDETSPKHGVQDLELSTYLRSIGYQHCYLENYFTEHILGTEGQQAKFPEYFERRKSEKVEPYAKA